MGDETAPMVLNLPSSQGRAAGRIMAAYADREEPRFRQEHPTARERCADCAFRLGTVANQCAGTAEIALGCSLSGEPFYCHREGDNDFEPNGLCAGWRILSEAIERRRRAEASRPAILLGPISDPRPSPETPKAGT